MRGKGRVTIQFGCCYNYAVDREGRQPGTPPLYAPTRPHRKRMKAFWQGSPPMTPEQSATGGKQISHSVPAALPRAVKQEPITSHESPGRRTRAGYLEVVATCMARWRSRRKSAASKSLLRELEQEV